MCKRISPSLLNKPYKIMLLWNVTHVNECRNIKFPCYYNRNRRQNHQNPQREVFSHQVLSLPLRPKYSLAAVNAATTTTWSSRHHRSSVLSRCDSCQQSDRELKAPAFFVQARITVFIHGCSLLCGVGALCKDAQRATICLHKQSLGFEQNQIICVVALL